MWKQAFFLVLLIASLTGINDARPLHPVPRVNSINIARPPGEGTTSLATTKAPQAKDLKGRADFVIVPLTLEAKNGSDINDMPLYLNSGDGTISNLVTTTTIRKKLVKTSIWPMPLNVTEGSEFLNIDPANLEWIIAAPHRSNCHFLDAVLDRYRSNHLYQRKAGPKKGKNSEPLSSENSAVKPLKSVNRLFIYLNRPNCDNWPSRFSDESYSLTVDDEAINLTVDEDWGLIYGLETLSQLIIRGSESFLVPKVQITDQPRFSHRGIILDSTASFLPIQLIKQTIDTMLQNKLNVLHWRIAGEQAFRLKLNVMPEVSSSAEFYSRAEVQDLVEYARQRAIRVVPDISMPNDVSSWLRLFPAEIFLPCGSSHVLNPTNRQTYWIIRRILSEITELFPDHTMSIGGTGRLFPLSCWKNVTELISNATKNNDATLEIGHALVKLRQNISSDPRDLLRIFYKRLFNIHEDSVRKLGFGHQLMLINEETYRQAQKLSKTGLAIHVHKGKGKFAEKVAEKGFKVLSSSCWWFSNDSSAAIDDWKSFYLCEPTAGKHFPNLMGGEIFVQGLTAESLTSSFWPRASLIAERMWSDKKFAAQDNLKQVWRRFDRHRCRMFRRKVPGIAKPHACRLGKGAELFGTEENAFLPAA